MRRISVLAVALLCLVTSAAPAVAGRGESAQFPPVIELPDGSFPEGIAVGRGSTFYVGSLADGSIYRGDLRSGAGAALTNPTGAFPFTTVGLDVDRHNRVWAAGAAAGVGRVYDGSTGQLLATYQFTAPFDSLINDVIVTADAAWFTDSGTRQPCQPGLCFAGEPRLFQVVLDDDGALPDPADPGAVVEIAVDVEDIYFSNLNGIETMPGNAGLIVVHNEAGALYHVDPDRGTATLLYGPPRDPALVGADGMSRNGRTLYVVENGASRIAVIQLDRSSATGTLVEHLAVEGARTPTTSALFGSAVYAVDAGLDQPFVGPYRIFRVER